MPPAAPPERSRSRDPLAVIRGLLAEDPAGTRRAIEELLTSEGVTSAALYSPHDAFRERTDQTWRRRVAQAVACVARLSAAKEENR